MTPRNYQMNEAVARSVAHLIGTNDVGIALTLASVRTALPCVY